MNKPTSKNPTICQKTSISPKNTRLSAIKRVCTNYKALLLVIIVVLSSNSALLADPDATILDLIDPNATATAAEATSNDTTETAQDLDPYFEGSGISGVLVNGNLSDASDIDYYKLSIPQNGQFDLKFNLLDISYETITDIEAHGDKLFFVTDSNALWLYQSEQKTLLATAAELAEAIAGLGANDIVISSVAITSDGKALLSLTSRGDLLEVDSTGTVSQVLTNATVTAFTGESSADLVSIKVDDGGVAYLADQIKIGRASGRERV